MSKIDIHHTLNILKAAFPYLNHRSKDTLELFIKAGELFDCLNNRMNKGSLSIYSIPEDRNPDLDKTNMVEMLKSIKKVCYDEEAKMIDSFLNLVNTLELYETYMNLFSMMSSSGDFGDFSDLGSMFGMDGDLGDLGSMFGMGDNSSSNFNNDDTNPEPNNFNMMEMLSSMLSPEDAETIDNLSMMLKMMNTTDDQGERNTSEENYNDTYDMDEDYHKHNHDTDDEYDNDETNINEDFYDNNSLENSYKDDIETDSDTW